MAVSHLFLWLTLLLTAAPALCQMASVEEHRAHARLHPDSAAAQSNYGVALKAAGELSSAMAAFRTAIELEPTYARGYNNLGNCLQALGQHARAVPLHGLAIELDPTLATAYSNLGNALRELGHFRAAADALGVSLQLNPLAAAAYTNLGVTTQLMGQPDRAAHWHRVAALLSPSDATVQLNLGAALEKSGRLEEAATALESALRRAPDNAAALLNMAAVRHGQGRLDESVSNVQAALSLDLDSELEAKAHTTLGTTYMAAGSSAASMEAYRAALALEPGNEMAQRNLDKLPVSPAYRAAASYECRVLASRAARVALALAGARRAGRGRSGQGIALLGRPPKQRGRDAPGGDAPLSCMLFRIVRYLRRLETEQVDL